MPPNTCSSGSQLPLNCALWMAYLLSKGYYVGFVEHFGNQHHFDAGLKPTTGKHSNRFIFNVSGMADIPEVLKMVEVRAEVNICMLDSVENALGEVDRDLKVVVVATMYDNFCGHVLPMLEFPWKGAPKWELRPGQAVWACDPADRHADSRDNLGIKILHFSYINAQSLQSQLLSMMENLNAKLTAEKRTLHLFSPSTDEMDKIDRAFCFATDFTSEISDMFTGMPEEFHNGSASTLKEIQG
jgi:hypothetical protein